MLDYMRESLAIAMKYKGELDEELEDTILFTICQDILNNYILLIPNEKNIRDSKIISNIDNSKVISEYTDNRTFGLFNVIQNLNSVEQIISFIKENSIIIQSDNDLIKEFKDIVRTADKLTNDANRHLTRRNTIHLGVVSKYYIDEYWKGTKLGKDIWIKELDFSGSKVSLVASSNIDIYFPERDMHSRGFLNIEDFYNDHKKMLFQHLRNEHFYFRTLSLGRACIYVTNESFAEYFGNQREGKLISFGESREKKVKIEKSDKDFIEWRIRKYIQPRDFIKLLEKDFL